MKKLITLILMAFCINAYADTPTTTDTNTQVQPLPIIYQVDIIAFKNIQGLQNLDASQWQPYQPMNFENTTDLEQQSLINPIDQTQLELYTPLAENKFILDQEAQRIKRSSLYDFITQKSWLQKVTKKAQAQTISITAGQNFTNTNMLAQVWELAGTVRISQSLYQYLNLNVSFYLTEPGTAISPNGNSNSDNTTTSEYPGLKMIVLKENRRIAVNQLNYIDSPGFGLLIKVVKLTAPPPQS